MDEDEDILTTPLRFITQSACILSDIPLLSDASTVS